MRESSPGPKPQCRLLINKPAPPNRGYNRDPSIKAVKLKGGGLLVMNGFTLQ